LWARRDGIRLHLDGARVFLQAAYTGEDVAETASTSTVRLERSSRDRAIF
jgi:threonine aldolase